jgi:rhodanese-related sulfurtransferase
MKYSYVIFTILTVFVLLACKQVKKHSSNSAKEQAFPIKTISVATLKAHRKVKKGLLLDVRTSEEIADGHIEAAVFLDYYRSDFQTQIQKFPKDEPVYIYCRSGNRSRKAAKKFAALGFREVYNIQGGFQAWKNAEIGNSPN